MNKNINIGIEIECIVNKELFSFDSDEIGDYHRGKRITGLSGWTAEQDGSLYHHNEFNKNHEIEFVSKVFKTKRQLDAGLLSFYKYFSKGHELELYKALAFNDSCGSHVHFSIDNFSFSKKAILKSFLKTRKYFFDSLQNSEILSKNTILSHYNRRYSRLLDKRNFKRQDRYSEFNFLSEQSNKGLEWRSLNLRGLTTWNEFFEMFDIIYKSIEFLIKEATHYTFISSIKYKYNEEENNNIEPIIAVLPEQQQIEVAVIGGF